MKLRILLINPWIYDFAAYNMWAKPLGMIKVMQYLSQFHADVHVIDCTDAYTPERFSAGHYLSTPVPKPPVLSHVPRQYRRYGKSPDDVAREIRSFGHADIVCVGSMMSYWYPGVQHAVSLVREMLGDVPIILCGVYASLYQEHAAAVSGVDAVYAGRIDNGFLHLLGTFGFRLKHRSRSTPSAGKQAVHGSRAAPILASTGCPYCCTYCASSLLSPRWMQRSPEDVADEVTLLAGAGVSDFAFYDDALLSNARGLMKPLLRMIIARGISARFHTPNGLHARFLDEELAALMHAAGFATIRLGLETADAVRQEETVGKVFTDDLERAVAALLRAGFPPSRVGVYLMHGLPGQSPAEVDEGVNLVRSLGVRICLTEFSPVRGTVAWDALVKDETIPDDLDPLLTNNSIFAMLFCGHDAKELRTLRLSVKRYNEGLL
ncbi:MAG TPA: B12-binding domain-containing radical SAM protein [Dissulfurispiraceae bacterium]|nr:B12-binding domain-containing radical SAM protein [Dissulfurispiraceae bacterium]